MQLVTAASLEDLRGFLQFSLTEGFLTHEQAKSIVRKIFELPAQCEHPETQPSLKTYAAKLSTVKPENS